MGDHYKQVDHFYGWLALLFARQCVSYREARIQGMDCMSTAI
jgi:hypothetical protein